MFSPLCRKKPEKPCFFECRYQVALSRSVIKKRYQGALSSLSIKGALSLQNVENSHRINMCFLID
jgi:hypothetical protein